MKEHGIKQTGEELMNNEPNLEDLILAGIVEVAAVDSTTGEFLYAFTKEAKTLYPELYGVHLTEVHNDVMYFWERGFLEVDDMSSKNPRVTLTEKAGIEEEILKLPKDKQDTLRQIKSILGMV